MVKPGTINLRRSSFLVLCSGFSVKPQPFNSAVVSTMSATIASGKALRRLW